MRPTTAEEIAAIIQAERWAARTHQKKYDRRAVELAVRLGIDPVRAIKGGAFVFSKDTIEELKKGLDL